MVTAQNKHKKIILPSLNKSPVRVNTINESSSIGMGAPNQNGNRKQVAFVEETTTITAGSAGIPAELPISGVGKNVRVRFSIEE